jgi:peptidoglycan/LPS O-acetylase OafA/YrhL
MSKPRIPELDGIRGLAILLVLIWHYLASPLLLTSDRTSKFVGRMMMQTWSGVDLFFVLSGFLIGGILLDARGSQTFFSTFYIRRFFRILPIYAVCCLAYFPLSILMRSAFHVGVPSMPWYTYATLTQNLWLTNSRWPVYLVQTWSLAVEEQFYLTLPLLVWFVTPKNLWKIAAIGVVFAMGFRFLLMARFHSTAMTAAYVLLPCRADALLAGLLAAIAIRNARARRWIENNRRGMGILVGASLAILLVCGVQGVGVMTPRMSGFGYTGLALFYVCILLLTLTSCGWLRRFFSNRVLRWLGTIAYGLYLVHVPMLNLSAVVLRHFPVPIFLSAAISASLLLSHLSWKLFESRMVEIGHRFVYKENRQGSPIEVGILGLDSGASGLGSQDLVDAPASGLST